MRSDAPAPAARPAATVRRHRLWLIAVSLVHNWPPPAAHRRHVRPRGDVLNRPHAREIRGANRAFQNLRMPAATEPPVSAADIRSGRSKAAVRSAAPAPIERTRLNWRLPQIRRAPDAVSRAPRRRGSMIERCRNGPVVDGSRRSQVHNASRRNNPCSTISSARSRTPLRTPCSRFSRRPRPEVDRALYPAVSRSDESRPRTPSRCSEPPTRPERILPCPSLRSCLLISGKRRETSILTSTPANERAPPSASVQDATNLLRSRFRY